MLTGCAAIKAHPRLCGTPQKLCAPLVYVATSISSNINYRKRHSHSQHSQHRPHVLVNAVRSAIQMTLTESIVQTLKVFCILFSQFFPFSSTGPIYIFLSV